MTTSTSRRSSNEPGAAVSGRPRRSLLTEAGTVHVLASIRADGDFHRGRIDPAELEARRRTLIDAPWTMLDQVHGTEVVGVARPGEGEGHRGDIAVVDASDAVVGVWAADCAPVVIVAPDGRFAAAHAGWRGLAAGVIDLACDALGFDGAASPGSIAVLGPCIRSCCNEFGRAELGEVARGTGAALERIMGTTTWGTAALDVPGAVRSAFARRGVDLVDEAICTGCDDRFFSHRMRGDQGRHVLAVWRRDEP